MAQTLPTTIPSRYEDRSVESRIRTTGGHARRRWRVRDDFPYLPQLAAGAARTVYTFSVDAEDLDDVDIVTTFTPGFAGTIVKFFVVVTEAVSTGSKACTLNLEVGTTNLTGGTIALAGAYSLGAVVASAAITAGAAFTSTDTISVEGSSTTAFAEGQFDIVVVVQPASGYRPAFELAGTNMTSALCAWDTTNYYGGVLLTTAGANNDSAILQPGSDVPLGPLGGNNWVVDDEPAFECFIRTGAVITCEIYAGMKITNTDTVITDADQFFFRFDPAVNSGTWGLVTSTTNVDETLDSGVTVAANTWYHLAAFVDIDRKVHYYIAQDWDPDLHFEGVGTTALATTIATLNPYVGVVTAAAALANLSVLWVECSKKMK